MKLIKHISKFALSGLMVFIAFSCDEQFDIKDGGKFAAQIYPPAAMNYLKGETTSIDVPYNTFENEGQTVASYNVYKKLTAGGVSSDEVSYTGLTGEAFTQTSAQLFADVPVGGDVKDETELAPGDKWDIRYEIVMSDGRVLAIGIKTVISFTCPSALSGDYDGLTNWTDYYGNPGTNSYTTTLTAATLAGTYNLDDLAGGMEIIVWGGTEVNAVIKDVCDVITLVSASYSYPYYIDAGDVDADGVIYIKWRNVYDENGETWLTPQ